MRFPTVISYLLLALPTSVTAVFRDEVGHIDYHHELIGLPQPETTLFHRPRRTDKASLLYTFSDAGVLAAVNPGNGELVWRQTIDPSHSSSNKGYLRASDGEGWICSASQHTVQAWDAVGGRSLWSAELPGLVKDLEVVEGAGTDKKDMLVLFEEDGATFLRRLRGGDGSVAWEFRETTSDAPLQVSSSVDKVFVVGLHNSAIRVTVIDTATGTKTDDITLGSSGDVQSEKDIVFVGANSAAPVLAWTDAARSELKISVLGSKEVEEFPLVADVTSVEIHAPHLAQSQPHFLVHTKTATGNKADVYHVDIKSNNIKHAYELGLLPGTSAFATASIGANVYFTRITNDEVILTESTSDAVLGRWDLKADSSPVGAVHAVSEVVKKSEDSYAVRAAAVTTNDDWVLIRNGEQAWTRPEGLTGVVSAVFAEIPESEALAKNLELEAHSNPISAFIHRLKRHICGLANLPGFLISIPTLFLDSVLGMDMTKHKGPLHRDSFGLHKLVVMATGRGKLYCLDTGFNGQIHWSVRAFDMPAGEQWDVKGMLVDEHKGEIAVRGSKGEAVTVRLLDGQVVETLPMGPSSSVQSTVVVDSASGSWLLPVGPDGKVGDIPIDIQPTERLVVRTDDGELKGLTFAAAGEVAKEVPTWSFKAPAGQKILHVATRNTPEHIASIGRVLGDRSVLYKYLNPNTIVVAAGDEGASTLTVYLLDTVSGQLLMSARYTGIDVTKPVECAMAENWFLCSFYGQFVLRDNKSTSVKGWQLVVSDLYESDMPNYRGPLGEVANFSSLNPLDGANSPPALPHVISQAFVLAARMGGFAVSRTRQGISTRELLAYLPDTHAIIGIPRTILEPRRPVGRDPTAGEKEEGLSRYVPALEVDPRLVVTHERDVLGVDRILTEGTLLESTSLVVAFGGVDVFGTRVAPSFAFDVLGKGFNKVTLVGTVLALGLGVLVLGPVVRKKQINLGFGGNAA